MAGFYMSNINADEVPAKVETAAPEANVTEERSSEKQETIPLTPRQALVRLMDGNLRYIQDKLLHPNRSQERRLAVVNAQTPFAIILGCSDSRVAPEIVFDQGIGDLFVVRVAGNVAGPIELDSIEYSGLYLGSSIVLVLGHESCGAVTAVVQHNTKEIENIAELIEPAVKASAILPGNRIENAVKANVRMTVDYLKKTPNISKLIHEGKLDVIGGYYHLNNGEVEILR